MFYMEVFENWKILNYDEGKEDPELNESGATIGEGTLVS
jgi:hypothetical protein